MKKLYEFTITKQEEKEKIEISKNEKGEEIKITKKVKESVPYKFFIKKPTRALYDESECFFAKKVSEYVKQDILPAVQLEKRYLNDGGVFSEAQKKQYETLYAELFAKQEEYKNLQKLKPEEITPDVKERSDKLLIELIDVMNRIQSIENSKSNIYNHTAENLARNQVMLWWTLQLSYQDLGNNNYKPFFGDGSYEDKLKVYDKIEEDEDEFNFNVVKKLLLVTSLWFLGKAEKQEDFELLLTEEVNEQVEQIKPEPKTESPTEVDNKNDAAVPNN